MASNSIKRVVIVGGGIAGLAAAYRLRRLAPELEVLLVERETRLGGKILSEQLHGCLIEAGADSILSHKPAGVGLIEELGLTGRLQGQNERRRKTFVRRGGALHRLPEGLTGLVPTNLEALAQSSLISPAGRARLEQEQSLPPAPGNEDESIAAFITRRMGAEVFEQLIEPLMGGIYAGDATRLSLRSTFPQLRELERAYGSVITGLLASRPSSPASSQRYPPFVSMRDGMGELVDALYDRLLGVVQCVAGCGAVEVRAGASGYTVILMNGRSFPADAVILATPAFATAELLAQVDPELAALHAAIPYASTATVSLAYDEEQLAVPLDGFGYVVPLVEGGAVLACTWSSSKWEGRAPAGTALLRLYFGRYGRDEVVEQPDEDLLELARAELRETLGIEAVPRFSRIYRWLSSMPQYTLGHPERLARIEQRLAASQGLFVAGAAYRGIGIPDCINSGDQAARGVISYLESRTASYA